MAKEVRKLKRAQARGAESGSPEAGSSQRPMMAMPDMRQQIKSLLGRLAIPVVAMLLSLLDLYRTRYELLPELQEELEAEERADGDEGPGPDDEPPGGTGADRPDGPQAGATAV